jgi:hypothetical protein
MTGHGEAIERTVKALRLLGERPQSTLEIAAGIGTSKLVAGRLLKLLRRHVPGLVCAPDPRHRQRWLWSMPKGSPL